MLNLKLLFHAVLQTGILLINFCLHVGSVLANLDFLKTFFL